MRATVLHLGIPIGEVELPDDRPWAGGLLVPTPAYEGVAAAIREATRKGETLDFDLADEQGRRIPTELVRVVDLDDGRGGRVAAYFRTTNSGIVAAHRPKRSDGGGAAPDESH